SPLKEGGPYQRRGGLTSRLDRRPSVEHQSMVVYSGPWPRRDFRFVRCRRICKSGVRIAARYGPLHRHGTGIDDRMRRILPAGLLVLLVLLVPAPAIAQPPTI